MKLNIKPPIIKERNLENFLNDFSLYQGNNMPYFWSDGTINDLIRHEIFYGVKGLLQFKNLNLVEFKSMKILFDNLEFKNNKVITTYDNKEYELAPKLYKGEDSLIIKDITKDLFDPNNTNYIELWYKGYEEAIYNAVLAKIHSRHFVYNLKEFYKQLLKFRWFTKEEIREVLPVVIKDVGIKEIDYKRKDGSVRKRIVPEKYMIHMSFRSSILAQKDWKNMFPEEFFYNDLFIQGGDTGIVFTKKGNYRTAFCEVFPSYLKDGDKIFSSFIRGEGETIKEAEEKAFKKLIKIKNCNNHEWETKGRDNGHGFCKNCGVFNSKAF